MVVLQDVTPTADWWPYEFQFVPRALLIVERFDGQDGFQREISDRFVDNQTKDFDPRRFEALICVRIEMDGRIRYSVIDGQHRTAIAEGRMVDPIPAQVHVEMLDYQDRAALFAELNLKRRQLNTRQTVNARVQQEDEEALGLLSMLERHGFYAQNIGRQTINGHRPIAALGTLTREWHYNGAALDLALMALESWQDIHGSRMQGIMIGALCDLARQEKYNPARMAQVFSKYGPQFVMREAREEAARVNAKPTKPVMARTLARFYNNGLRGNRIEL